MTITDIPARVTPDMVRDKDDHDGRHYFYPEWGTLMLPGQRVPSMTNVLDGTHGKPHLVVWSAKLAAQYAVRHLYRLLRIKKLKGPDAAVKEAQEQAERIRDLKRDVGSYIHAIVEALVIWQTYQAGMGRYLTLPELPGHLKGLEYDGEPVEEVADRMVTGFLNWVSDWNPIVTAAEMAVFGVRLNIAGTLDLIIELHGVAVSADGRLVPAPGNVLRLCVDVKTGKNLDATVPEQVGGYRRMDEALLPDGTLIPMPPTDAGAVLHLRPEYERGYRMILIGGKADADAWNRLRRAVEIYAGRKAVGKKPGKVVYPLRPDGTMPSPRVADLDGEGYGAVPAALAKTGVEDLETLAMLTAEECLGLKGIGEKSIPVIRRMLADNGLHLAGEASEPSPAAETVMAA